MLCIPWGSILNITALVGTVAMLFAMGVWFRHGTRG